MVLPTKTRQPKFPLIVQNGSCIVKIYRDQTKRSGVYYRVSFYQGGRRCGLNFRDLEEARKEASAKADLLARGQLEALQITGRDRVVYGRALEAIRALGVDLDVAAMEYAEAKKIVGGRTLPEAAQFYMRHHANSIKLVGVTEAVNEMIEAKAQAGASKTYLSDLRYRLAVLSDAFHCHVSAIAPDDLREVLNKLKLAPRGFNNTLATLRTFFSFARGRGWLSKDIDLLAGIDKRREAAGAVEIYTPMEMTEILSNCSLEIQSCLALAAFAGLRSEEILRLDWADVERRPGYIEVAAEKAKTASRRLVPIPNNLVRWLAVAERKGARVWPHSKPWYFESQRETVEAINKARKKNSKKAAKFEWKANALRHSFISYRLAEIQDVNRVALEAGNSPKMIFQHYRELCTPAEAAIWFNLSPDAAANIIKLTTAK